VYGSIIVLLFVVHVVVVLCSVIIVLLFLVDVISTHSFLVCLCVCVYFILSVFVLIWAKLPDINKNLAIANRSRVSCINTIPCIAYTTSTVTLKSKL